MSDIAGKKNDVEDQLKDLLQKERFKKEFEAANKMKSFKFGQAMDEKDSKALVKVMLDLGKMIPYIGTAISVSLILESNASPEMTMLNEIKEQISDLHRKVDGISDELRGVLDWHEVDKAAVAVKVCQIELEDKQFEKLEDSMFNIKKSEIQTCILHLKNYLTNHNNFMNKLAQDADYDPAAFISRLARVWIPYSTGIGLLCSLDILKCKEILVQKRCEEIQKQYGLSEVEKSINEHFDDLYFLRNGDAVILQTTRSDNTIWSIDGCMKNIKGYWVTCRKVTNSQEGGKIILRRKDLSPEKYNPEDTKGRRDQMKVDDIVSLSSSWGYIYRFPGSFITDSNYCFSLPSKKEVKGDGDSANMHYESMHWKMLAERSGTIKDGSKIIFLNRSTDDFTGYRDLGPEYGEDRYLACKENGYVGTDPGWQPDYSTKRVYPKTDHPIKQQFRVQIVRLMSLKGRGKISVD